MAYVAKDLPENEQNKFGPTGPTTAFPAQIPQTGGSAGSAQAKGAPPGVGTSTQFGSNASKLSDYLSANAPNIEQFGNKIAGDLTQGYSQAQQGIDTGYQNFNNQVNSGYSQANPDLVNQAASNPTKFASNPDNVKQFQSLYNNQYKGPENFESTQPYSDINSSVNKAVENASLASSPQGLGTYLSGSGYSPFSTQGVKSLDTALIQGNSGARNAISTAAQPYQNLSGYLSNKTSDANKNVATAKQNAQQTSQDVQNRFTGAGGVVPTFQADIQKRVGDTQNQEISRNKAVEDFISGNATDEDLNLLNITPQQKTDLFNDAAYLKPYVGNIDLGRFSTGPTGMDDYSPEKIATPDDYAMAAALSQLTGQPGSLDQSKASLAGTSPSDFRGFDIQGALRELEDNRKRFGQPTETGGGGSVGAHARAF